MSGFIAFRDFLAQMIFKIDLRGALLLIVLGAMLVLKPWFDKQGLFSRAKHS